jgi:hypothetical protein
MGNYVIGVGNYLSATPSELGNYMSADTPARAPVQPLALAMILGSPESPVGVP